MWRSVPLSFNMITHAIETRHEEIKLNNPTRTHPVVAIDANVLGCKTPSGMEAAKCVELLAAVFSSNSAGVLARADHPSKRHYTKREIIRRKCEKERNDAAMREKRAALPSLLQHSSAGSAKAAAGASKKLVPWKASVLNHCLIPLLKT